ncbi:MAG: glycosyltransferase family 9 protein [Leptolyngbyaceae cyanobacterium SL_7_1]|nr:glycosyltransferase family 9 protein [Leptolyngbyaceae cyanobacterium SL_7_1]
MRSILFVELLGGMGDILIALPAIHALARSHTNASITVLTFAPGAELLQHDPWVQRVVVAEAGAARRSLDQLLATESFDLIVSDTNYDGMAERIQSTTAQTVTNMWRSPPADALVSDRFLSILLSEGVITQERAQQRLAQLHPTATETATAREVLGAAYRPLIFLCPDAGMAIKRWSVQHFTRLGQVLQQRYRATILVPVGANQAEAEALSQSIGGTAQVWRRGSLRSLAAVLAEADLVIAADTGLARIAAAVNTPTITLFGPSWHGRYGQPAPHVNLQGVPDCPERVIGNFTEQRCWYSGDCPFAWATCVDMVTPEQVMQAAAGLLKHPQPNAASLIPQPGQESQSKFPSKSPTLGI